MIRLALRLLEHDRPKFLGMVLAVALAAFLTQNQASILASFLSLAGSQIHDVREAQFWVMEPDTPCFDQARPVRDTTTARVRGVPGVRWALGLTRFDAVVRTASGRLNAATFIGVPEESRLGLPDVSAGDASAALRRDGALVDPGGFALLFPGETFRPGLRLRVTDRWLDLAGVSTAAAPFTGLPIIHVAQGTAAELNRGERRGTTFVVGTFAPGADPAATLAAITARTGAKALTRGEFAQASADFYAAQGVPALFYVTIAIGFAVGVGFTGQTFVMFVKEHARSLVTLKALGVDDRQLAGMMAAQTLLVLALGLSAGTALAAAVTRAVASTPFLRGLYLPWEIAAGCAGGLALVVFLAAGWAFRGVRRLQPAEVFRS